VRVGYFDGSLVLSVFSDTTESEYPATRIFLAFLRREKMRRLSLIIFLVCLMSSSAFASYLWMNDQNGIPLNWTTAAQWDLVGSTGPPSVSPGVPPLSTTNEIKMITHTWMTSLATCTIDSNVGIYTANSSNGGRVTVNGEMLIQGSNAVFGVSRTASKNGLRVGSLGAGGITMGLTADVKQSGGIVVVSNLYLGYGGTMTSAPANGTYIISGNSTLTITDDSTAGGLHTGGLSVGSGVNTASTDTIRETDGTFVVVGNSPTINVTAVVVGGNLGGYSQANHGTLEFDLDGAVSPINCTSVSLDGPNSTTALVVKLLDENAPVSPIVLINQGGKNAVNGKFDTVDGGSVVVAANEGTYVTLKSPGGAFHAYLLTYKYDATSGHYGSGNDTALIPEPATIALFSLGLLALVRRPRRK